VFGGDPFRRWVTGWKTRYLDKRSFPIKSTIALILAGGYAEGFPSDNGPIFKACLPVNGRPVVEFVIRALEGSLVEKIFIAQEQGARLQDRLVTTDKCVFFDKKNHPGSFGLGILSAFENVAEYYGNSELSEKMILVVPCDTPLVSPENFNNLLEQAACKSADVMITIISASCLADRFPDRQFRTVYLADYEARYTMQNVIFINGDFIRLDPYAASGKLKFSFRGWDAAVLKRVVDGISSIDDLRHQAHFHNKIFLLWLLTRGYTSAIIKLFLNMFFRRLTMARSMALLSAADHMQAGYVESREAEFSADIDRPEDFPMLLGIAWDN
jgi:molybdopterin-guanine dinucleotide biosynthesis protein A